MIIVPLAVLFLATTHDAFFFNQIYILGFEYSLTETAITAFTLSETIILFFTLMQSVEKFKEAEAEIKIKNEALEQFLQMKSHYIGIIAHEIKTPLSVIMCGARESLDILENINEQYLEEDIRDIERDQNTIMETVNSLNETVFDLLDTTALETGRLSLDIRCVDLQGLIKHVTYLYHIQIEESGNELILDLEERLPPVFGDQKRLRQVIINMLSNAIRHTKNGTITIRLRQIEHTQVIEIIDSGEGISKEVLNKLTKGYIDGGPHGYRGGIGMYVSQQIIFSHKGKISISSENHKGAQIRIILPCMGKENK